MKNKKHPERWGAGTHWNQALRMVRRKSAHHKMEAKISQENKTLKLWQQTVPLFSMWQNSIGARLKSLLTHT